MADTVKKHHSYFLSKGLNRAIQMVIFASFILTPQILEAQNKTKVIIEKADILKFDQSNKQNITKLIGNVMMRQDSTLFYCDSAILDNSRNDMFAYGHVHINYNDSVDVYGKYLVYDGNTRVATLDTNVKMVDSRATLLTDHMIYNRLSHWAYYDSGGKIIDQENELTSIIGRYYTDSKDLFFKDSVVMTNPDYILKSDTLIYNTITEIAFIYGPTHIYGEEDYIYAEDGWYDTKNDVTRLKKNALIRHMEQTLFADSIFYDSGNGYGNADGNIVLHDTVQDVMVKGNKAEFDRKKRYSYVTDSAMAIFIDNRDSLYLHADTLKMIMDTAEKADKLLAYYKMKFFRDDLQGACDSLVYSISDSIIYLYDSPVLWAEENQLTGDSILIFVSHNHIDSLTMYNTAFIVSQDTVFSFNQIKGRMMTAYFNKNELYEIVVSGNAETVYYVREEDATLIGVNKSLSSIMRIDVEDGKIKNITYLDQPDAALYPEEQLSDQDLFLRGFKWIVEKRPSIMKDIFFW